MNAVRLLALNHLASVAIDEDDVDETSDDDSEYLLLAPWFDETQSNSFTIQTAHNQPTEANDNTSGNNRCNAQNAGDISVAASITRNILDATFELDANQNFSRHIDIMTSTVDLLVVLIHDQGSRRDKIQKAVSTQLASFASYLNEIEAQPDRLPRRFVSSYLALVKTLLFHNLLSHSQQVRVHFCCNSIRLRPFTVFWSKNELLGHLGLKLSEGCDWPLQIGKPKLTVIFQMFALRFNTDQNALRGDIQLVWKLFLASIRSKIEKRRTDFVLTGELSAALAGARRLSYFVFV